MRTANVTTQDNTKIVWNAIDWRATHRSVNNLRQRIYRATVEGNLKRVRNLQKLQMRSRAAALAAIRQVTQVNQGRRTPGVDKIVVKTDKKRTQLYHTIKGNKLGKVYPIKRVYIPKKNGKQRPLGLPTIVDRCRQAIVKFALEPHWEAKFERTSYGFRPGRSAQDAMQKIFCIVRPGKSRRWVLDADIKGAFDNIEHTYLLNCIGNFPGREWIKLWLKCGVLEKQRYIPTTRGTPQGSVVSPLLANIALHGMEDALNVRYDSLGRLDKSSCHAVVRYADDFVVFSRSKSKSKEARKLLDSWLAKRGLQISTEKTSIRHIAEGFDFLGFNTRQYRTRGKRKGYVVLVNPSKTSIKAFKEQIRKEWRKSLTWETRKVIRNLNPKIKGWANYFKSGTSKRVFVSIDHWMWKRQERFVARRHPNKHWWWKKPRYWGYIPNREDSWVFKDKRTGEYLWKLSWTPIKRHILVKGAASPDNPDLKEYWEKRRSRVIPYVVKLRSILWRKQNGLCTACLDELGNGEEVHIHHLIPKSKGGNDKLDNLNMLHATCHRQLHSKHGNSTVVSKLLEPYAG